jgi:hypothetical protein
MMRKIFYLAICCFFTVVGIANAQHAEKIKKDAEIMCKATLNGDFNTLAGFTHPIVLKAMGGKDKMIGVLTNGFRQMKTEGMSFYEAGVGEPGEIINIGTELYSVVPQKVVMQAKGFKIHSTSSLLAISSNKGANWYFLDAGGMTDAQFKQFFPNAYGKIQIPKRVEPTVVRD